MSYEFRLYCKCPESYQEKATWLKIDAYQAKPFEPYDLCDSAKMAYIFNGRTAEVAMRIDEDRKKLAYEIARELTDTILEQIKSRDTVNGYPQEQKL